MIYPADGDLINNRDAVILPAGQQASFKCFAARLWSTTGLALAALARPALAGLGAVALGSW